MVNGLLLLVLLGADAASAASLSTQADRTSIALGEPVSLTIHASGLSLDALDLAPLAANFDVFARTLSRGTDSESLVLTLYPVAVGTLQIPALPLQTRRTAALPLTVVNGSETMPHVTSNWVLDPAAPQVNQPARLTLSICDDGSLQWRRPSMPTHSGRVLYALGEEEGRAERDGEPCTLHRFFWRLVASQSGVATLGVPMLDASRFGQRLRFPGPQLSYQAAALPAWLPAHVPPVAPHIESAALPSRWPLNRPLAWHLDVTGGYGADDLKVLIDLQLRDSPVLQVYPPLVEALAMDDPNSPLSRYGVTLFLQPRARGQLAIPTLRLPWFDQKRGVLSHATVAGRTLEVFDPRWQLAARVAAALAGGLLLGWLVWQSRRSLRWRLARRRGVHAIRAAGDIAELAQAVRRFSLSGQPAATTLGEWQRRIQQETLRGDVADAVQTLEQQQFGQTACTLATLKQGFLQALARARPKPKTAGWRIWR